MGRYSWASQTPASRHDLYLQEARPATLDGRILGEFAPARGVWIAQDEIASLFVLAPDFDRRAMRRVLWRRLRLSAEIRETPETAPAAPVAGVH